MEYLRDLVTNTYDSTDESKKAFHFYEKLQNTLENEIRHWVDTNDIQIICLERLGHIQQINNNYESAVVSFEQCIKIQRDNDKNLDDILDKLHNIGLLHMTLGNHTLALASFNEAMKLIPSYSESDAWEERMILMRIDENKTILKLMNDS
ncbi:unnamed protein product [Rotaria sp. Silwood2]|nr:unnamed protein product [Rotaria sp. Silwood2]CAF3366120.1 unnamed protein product [Rotaria sp. Silwood2]CAF4260953.1 unnamed protein product [Rotaria sp. Silwood2]CAF4291833.1 unnamed protein product [Rotaria sp. Silwood2]CAF4343446.1 unnamed protein product [Rotaria sp. Silwood2]